jgi:hypothetical protein
MAKKLARRAYLGSISQEKHRICFGADPCDNLAIYQPHNAYESLFTVENDPVFMKKKLKAR